jgi:RNA polymerase sigma factor FliA
MKFLQPGRRLTAEEGLALWRQYRRGGDAHLRDRLILTYAPLVKHLAYKRVRELPAELEIEDLISAGLEALIASIDRFDPEKGATLEQYAWTRIHGALVDELRKRDWAPRSLRRFQREARKATELFTSIHGRGPTRDELADALSMSVEDLQAQQSNLRAADVRSLNAIVGDPDEGDVEMVETLATNDPTGDPVHHVMADERRHRFRQAVAQLPERERQVAVLRYVKELTLQEIGDIMGVSESRISQIDSKLKARLRAELVGTAVEPRAA